MGEAGLVGEADDGPLATQDCVEFFLSLRPNWRIWYPRALILVLVLTAVAALLGWAVSGIGRWLVVADSLNPAGAIVVLAGHLPFRAMEAAALYQQGWAPEVWVTRGLRPAEEEALAQLGVRVVGEEVYTTEVLKRLGVPPVAIRSLSEGGRNTAEEVHLIAREARQMGGNRVILVTSKPHTRRVRAIWQALVGNSLHAVIRYARDDPYDPDRWWQHSRDALAVSREFFGLLNVWAGFPVRQDAQ